MRPKTTHRRVPYILSKDQPTDYKDVAPSALQVLFNRPASQYLSSKARLKRTIVDCQFQIQGHQSL